MTVPLAQPRSERVAVPPCTTPPHPAAPTVLHVVGEDWNHIGWNPELAEWNEQVAPGRWIIRIELVDEGTARLHTIRHTTARARHPDVVPDWTDHPCRWCADWGVICTAVYIPTPQLPRAILERMHP